MRGNHDGTFTYAHQLRDGKRWDSIGLGGEHRRRIRPGCCGRRNQRAGRGVFLSKDSGKERAHFGLDNHDDFGGHAKRNDFSRGRTLLSYGGTQSIESPGKYSDVAKGLLAELGIQTDSFYKAYDQKLYSNLGTAAFFDKETFGADCLVTGMNATPWPIFWPRHPFPDTVRRDLAVYTRKKSIICRPVKREKLAKLGKSATSELSGETLQTHRLKRCRFPDLYARLFCVGVEAVSARACYEAGVRTISRSRIPALTVSDFRTTKRKSRTFSFSGRCNATFARLLVRSLIPGAVPGETWMT